MEKGFICCTHRFSSTSIWYNQPFFFKEKYLHNKTLFQRLSEFALIRKSEFTPKLSQKIFVGAPASRNNSSFSVTHSPREISVPKKDSFEPFIAIPVSRHIFLCTLSRIGGNYCRNTCRHVSISQHCNDLLETVSF